MSAQGATLRRGTVHIPIWPVAVVVAAAAATLIGLTTIDRDAPIGTVTTVTESERLANSTAAIREQGAVLPVVVGISHVTPTATGFAGFENPGAYVTQAPAYAGFEYPGAYGISQVTEGSHPVGLENPGAYPAAGSESGAGFTPTMGARPSMVGNEICGQCR
jgi:hypothetical protein